MIGAACAGAALVVLSFAPTNIGPAVLLAWTPLLALAPKLTWRQRLVAGWLMGTLYQAGLFRWIPFTTREMSGLPLAAGLGALLGFALWHGLMSGVSLALCEPARRSAERIRPGLGLLGIAVVFTAVEWAWPILFPWALGHALWQIPQIASLLAWTGTPGLSCLAVLSSACLAHMVLTRHWRGAGYGLTGIALLVGLAGGWWWHVESTPVRRTLNVGVLQMNYTLEEKKRANLATRQKLFKRLTKTLATMPPGAVDLLVGSEGAFPLYWDVTAIDDSALDRPGVSSSTRATRTVANLVVAGPRTHAILGGLRLPQGEKIRNSAVHIYPDGVLGDHYDKQVLVPFGEYLPGA
ncbi:MAG: hypothetical protein VX938_09810, partial [Myxococcota bacterium]|nr:hypothetical protein [Myxococcota bacterium]